MDVVDGGSSGSVAGLYEAAISGSVANLDTLLKQYGKVILHRVSLTSLVETPLHLAALLGHLEFSKRLLELKPDLVIEQDAEKCTPLHLAAANGHDHVVRELLKGELGQKACLIQDQEGRTPLHLAAMRGRLPVVQELLKSKHAQQTVKMKVEDGDSVLHLCVKHNHLDVLKVVVDSTTDDGEVLKMTDSRGNTILHLAVMLKHKETVRYLVELARVHKEVINTTNWIGFSAVDVLNNSPRDFKSLEIHEILNGVARLGQTARPGTPLAVYGQKSVKDGAVEVVEEHKQVDRKHAWLYVRWACHYVKRLMDYRGDWMNETKGSLMMVSSIIATVTFSAAVSPPGGVWQEDIRESVYNACSNTSVCVAGNAVGAYLYPDNFSAFMKYDMVSFFGSLMVVFLLVSGFPLHNKFCLWILSLAMCLTISFLGLTFLEALWLVVPRRLQKKYYKFRSATETVWYIMMGICGLCLSVRLSSWLRRLCKSPLLKGVYSRMSERLQVNRRAYWNNGRPDTLSGDGEYSLGFRRLPKIVRNSAGYEPSGSGRPGANADGGPDTSRC